MKLLLQYLISYKKTGLLFLSCIVIYAVVFFLSNSDLDPVLYGGLLCFIGTAGFVGYDFYQFRAQHRKLQALVSTIDSQIDHLPEPRRMIDADYTEIIRSLHEQKRQFESHAYIGRKEMADYFTLWAHQIKTPISAMDLLLQAGDGGSGQKKMAPVQDRQEEGTSLESTVNIRERDKRLAIELFNIEEYVNLAMSYIRIEDISQDLGFDTLDLDHLIRQTLKKYADIFIGKRITIDFRATGQSIVSDAKWLGIVLGQVLSNALKYTAPGGKITISMETCTLSHSGRACTVRGRQADQDVLSEAGSGAERQMLVIADTGIGIKAEDLPRLFSKGFTGYNGRQHSKSSGQGLYLCKTIMDKLSHQIFLTSEEGKGTKVYLDFSR